MYHYVFRGEQSTSTETPAGEVSCTCFQRRSQHLAKRKLQPWFTEQSKGSSENTEDETLSHPVEKPVVIPLQSAQPTEPNPRELPRESKSVRICEVPSVCIPDAPRSVPTSACQPFSFLLRCVNFTVFVIFLFLGFMRTTHSSTVTSTLAAASQEPVARRNLFWYLIPFDLGLMTTL